MEENEPLPFQARATEFVKKNFLFIGLVATGVILVGIGLVQYFTSKEQVNSVEFIPATAKQAVSGVTTGSKAISVDVEGSVQNPGVYSLADESRVQDALIASGGMSPKADRDYVSKHFNLAQKLIDGSKIYIPQIGENTSADISVPTQSASNSLTAQSVGDTTGLININSATSAQLDTLPKVGPVTAAKIISSRPYGSIEELVSKKVLTQKTFDGLKDKITTQ